MQLNVFQLVDLNAEILQSAKTADTFDELLLLELVRRPGHNLDFDAAGVSADQVLDDGGVLVALVLEPKRMLALVDELSNALPPVMIMRPIVSVTGMT